jgi:hypothetical protein
MTLLPQSRQSARLFLQSSYLGPPPSSTPGECVPPTFVWGGGDTHLLAGEGDGGSQFRRGDRHCVTLGTVYVYFVVLPPFQLLLRPH